MRLELSDGSSHKFWEITQRGASLRIRWGRIGTAGQEQTKTFASPDAAKREHDKLVASKRKKGYAAAQPRTEQPAAKAKPTAKVAVAPTSLELPGGVPATRPVRDHALSWYQSDAPLEAALKDPGRVRAVSTEPSVKLKKFRRLFKLELTADGALPAWLGELRHLRTLQAGGGFSKLPASVLALPHLRFLHLDHSNLASLDGIDKLPALETVTFNDTPLGDDEEARAALLERLGATEGGFGAHLELARKRGKPPRGKPQLVRAINDDTLPDESDLRKVDLSGARFEDAYITHDLRGAKLANTIWVRCDFEWGSLAGADLTGATFYDCYFHMVHDDDGGNLAKVKAPGVTFVGCGGELQLAKADVRGARLLDMDHDVSIDLEGANARDLVLQAQFVSEKEHSFSMKGADLRGAHLRLDITAGRRAELRKKKTARLAWKTDHFKGAKLDKTTRVEYVPLDPAESAPATRPAARTVDPKGEAAEILGPMYASNASLWLLVADADVATRWRGAVDEDDPEDDFQRALAIEDKKISIGEGTHGVIVRVGYNGTSPVFRHAHGIALVDADLQGERAERDRAIALRVAQWPITTKPKPIGTFACPSGIAALLLPYQSGAFSAKQRAKANAGAFVVEPLSYDRALVPLPEGPGLYEVARYPLRPEKSRSETYEDDAGEYGDVLLISYRQPLSR